LFAGAAALAAGVAIGSAVQWGLSNQIGEPLAVQALAPAQAAVQETPAPALPPAPASPPQLLEPDQARRIDGYSPGTQQLLTQRIAATREVLQNSPDEHYAVELFVTENDDPARMERFLLRARDMVPLEELFVIPMPTGKHYRLRVVLGDFASREEALAAEKRLPPKYQAAFRTSPRSFAELRSQI
jgi:septal ring-binding cell division protein DamX